MKKYLILILFFFGFYIPTRAYSAGTVILNENFTTFPNSWSLSGGGWTSTNTSYHSPSVSIMPSKPSLYLIMGSTYKHFSLSGYDDAQVTFYYKMLSNNGLTRISYYDGWTWINLSGDLDCAGEWTFKGPYTIPIPQNGQSGILLSATVYTGDLMFLDDVIVTANKKPSLSWTGESGYESDGIYPDAGLPSQTFTWRIKYIDGDNNPPTSIRVHILKGGAEISGSPFNMTYVSGQYNTGAIFTYSRTLSLGSNYTYYFNATDGWLAANNSTTKAGPVVTDVGITGYVSYPDGTGMPCVTVDLTGTLTKQTITNDNGYYEFTDMTYDGNYTIIPSSFSYYSFNPLNKELTNLKNVQVVNFVRDNSFTGAVSYTGEPGYENDGVHPDIALPSQIVTYKIKYIDSDNDPPANGYPKLHIRKRYVAIENSPFTMNELLSSGITYCNGKVFYYSIILPPGEDYTYQFEAGDIWSLPATSFFEINGPTVNEAPFKPELPGGKAFNYPNPFNPQKQSTNIVFKVNNDQTVKIKIYSEYGDLLYQTTASATEGVNEFFYAGRDDNGKILYNGSYICRIEKAEGVSKCYILIIK